MYGFETDYLDHMKSQQCQSDKDKGHNPNNWSTDSIKTTQSSSNMDKLLKVYVTIFFKQTLINLNYLSKVYEHCVLNLI